MITNYINTTVKSVTPRRKQMLLLFLCISFLSCKKFVTVDTPPTQLSTQNVFTSDATALSAMNGVYVDISSSKGSMLNGGVTICAGLSADELANGNNASYGELYKNSVTPANSRIYDNLWNPAYKVIYEVNAVLEGLSKSQGVSGSMKQQLEGEAKFVRAFCNFYLVNLFGDIPLATTTDYRVMSKVSRTASDAVYQQIITDLTDAQTKLANDYSFSMDERVRPNKWAATALLARVQLYLKKWSLAESLSSLVIGNSAYSLESDPNLVFLKNSSEEIWQLMPVFPGENTGEGSLLINNPSYGFLTNTMLNAFESGDNRKTAWVASFVSGSQTLYYPYKYKVKSSSTVTEYYSMLRLAEQYLIRAEARAQQNNLSGAIADLNTIRTRAGLNTLSNFLSQSQVLAAVEQERRIELFAEWGHRWLDLKRTGRADAVLSVVKGNSWQPTDVLYPIPVKEIQNDPALTQNPGY